MTSWKTIRVASGSHRSTRYPRLKFASNGVNKVNGQIQELIGYMENSMNGLELLNQKQCSHDC
jgi:hypothetical protein